MADSYDQASTEIDNTKRAMLAAMAQAGTAGVTAYQQAQQAIAAQQQQAVQAALAGAAEFHAPAALQAELANTINAPYARYQADLTAARAYGDASNARSQAANAAYFDQAKAAIPALRTYSQAKAAEQAAARALDERKMALEERKLAMQEGGGDVLSALKAQLGGIGNANKYIADQGAEFLKAAKDPTDHGNQRAAYEGTQLTDRQYRDLFDRQAGLPEGYSNSQFKEPKAKAKGKGSVAQRRTQTLADLERKYGSKSTVTKAVRFIASGASNYAEALDALDEGFAQKKLLTPGGKPLSRRALVAWLKRYYS